MPDSSASSHRPLYLDPQRSIPERVADLISRMSLEEKLSQLMNKAPAIPHLGIPEYDWWNECLHGVGRAGIATVFPQAIGLAATWNVDLMSQIAAVISDEARAKHHEFLRQNEHGIYKGLTFWSPNINIFRDPRWGRGQETYGEDPHLTARLGVVFTKGLQGDDPKYLKLVATPKHFAVHSGPEAIRRGFNVEVNAKDLEETYLPAFEACVKEAHAASIMGAYNRVNGEPSCASPTLLQQILRDKWGFEGYVVSDCGAITYIQRDHQVVSTLEESTAIALKAGCDLECGSAYKHGVLAVEKGLLSEETIDLALTRLFAARFKLGMFDPPEMIPYAQIPITVNDCAEHRALALRTAQECIVLLKNANNTLPLSRNLKRIAVIGPNADSLDVLLGNYNGTPSTYVTPLQGVRNKVGTATEVVYAQGCELQGKSTEHFAEAVDTAKNADVAVVVLGLSPRIEGEQGESGDRVDLDLPGVQEELLQAVVATGTPVVLVLLGGSAVAVNWADVNTPAIIAAWYPGEAGGTAVANVLFGDYNPAGRLPVTFYKSVDQLPSFTDYRMVGRTYRFFTGEPLYPFGYGLSYTSFAYSKLCITPNTLMAGESITVTVAVENIGSLAGDEVVQLYLSHDAAPVRVPIRQLEGFTRIHLLPGETKQVQFTLTPRQLSIVLENGERVVEPGLVSISIGGGQPGTSAPVVMGKLEIRGQRQVLV